MVHILFGRNWIKGELKCKDMSWPVNIENVQNSSICRLHLVVLLKKKYFFVLVNLSCFGWSRVPDTIYQ